jgi:hypothetical protein
MEQRIGVCHATIRRAGVGGIDDDDFGVGENVSMANPLPDQIVRSGFTIEAPIKKALDVLGSR